MKRLVVFTALLSLTILAAPAQQQPNQTEFPTSQLAARPNNTHDALVKCANLVYAGSKTSQCFSDRFLTTTDRETNIRTGIRFEQVKLSQPELFEYPFAIMTGEGLFSMLPEERQNLRSYLERGGFLLASAGCSSEEWNQSFRREMQKVFSNVPLQKIPLEHPIYRTVFDVKTIKLSKSAGTTLLEGIELDGRIVVVYSPEGLNDTANVSGCCCCGGNEIKNSQEVNVNVLTYALTH